MITREMLQNEWLDYRNNYLTLAKFAEHRGLRESEAGALVFLARECHERNHPEA